MTFTNELKVKLRSQYTKNIVDSFYNPVLSQANLYQRVSAYFSSSGVDLYVDGLEELAKNGGEVQFVISKEISKKEFERIKKGYNLKEELKLLKLSERNDRLSSEVQEKLGNLAFMIANGRARVKVALYQKGLFHDKFGLVYSDDDVIFFNGSINETQSGISRNYESISVDVSWDSSKQVVSRIENSRNRFNRLWNNEEADVEVVEISELTYEEIAPFQEMNTISEFSKLEDAANEIISEETIAFRLFDETIVRIDNTLNRFTNIDRKLRIGSYIADYFFEIDNSTIKKGISYKSLEYVIEVTKKRAIRKNIKVDISKAVFEYILRNKYSINQYKILGSTIKEGINNLPEKKKKYFEYFSSVVQREVSRPLKEIHLNAAFFEYEMMRVANFSVPGSGKTAMILGVFAFLNSDTYAQNEKIDRILVISPLSAFESWKREFKLVFGEKKALKLIQSQDKNFSKQLQMDWKVSNLILINYEALSSNFSLLSKLIDEKTMLVFDEVHRIKNPDGKRAQLSLELSRKPKFKFVLTGTPIPNKYTDIYNFLNILYGNEYDSFFGWEIKELYQPKEYKIKEINEKMYPFFWRTNKKDLKVPKAEKDIMIVVDPTDEQKKLAEEIYQNEKSSLAKLIRLIQASTNPELLNSVINYNEIFKYDDDSSDSVFGISKMDFLSNISNEKNYIYDRDKINTIVSPKFLKGIDLIKTLVNEGKKVLVWGIFVDTLKKIQKVLKDKNIYVNLVYGGTPKEERAKIINDFREGEVQVLVSNPQTLGESISLHQTVHDAVYFEYDFNLTHMLQSRDRIHRLGLENNQYTRYYYLQTKEENKYSCIPGYVDGKIYRRIKEKEKIMYDAIDNKNLSIEYSDDIILEAINIIDEERKRIEFI